MRRLPLHAPRLARALLALAPLALSAPPASAAEDAAPPRIAAPAREDAVPDDAQLDGDEIYRRVQRNRLRSYVQHASLTSGDRGGNEQKTRIVTTWKNFRDGDEKAIPENGVLSKTLVRYTDPFDLRDTSYLVLHQHHRPSDQFVYLPSFRRVRRVNLRGEAIFGTDFSFEDVVPREFENSHHRRLQDERVSDAPCFVIELVPRPEVNSDYSKMQIYVEKQRYVPLRIRYWSAEGVEMKELHVERDSIREFDGAHIPMVATMRNLRLGTWTGLVIERLDANPDLPETTFDLRRLIRH